MSQWKSILGLSSSGMAQLWKGSFLFWGAEALQPWGRVLLAELECYSVTAPALQLPGESIPGQKLRSLIPAPLLCFFPSLLHCFLASSNKRVTPDSKSHKRNLLGRPYLEVVTSAPGNSRTAGNWADTTYTGFLLSGAFQGRDFQSEDW